MFDPQNLIEATAYAKSVHPAAVLCPNGQGQWEMRIPIYADVTISDFSLEMEGTPAQFLADIPVESPHYTNELEKWGYPEHRGAPIAVIAAYYNLELLRKDLTDDDYQGHLREISELHDDIRDAMDTVRDWNYD